MKSHADFTSIDPETASRPPVTTCAVGLAAHEDGRVMNSPLTTL